LPTIEHEAIIPVVKLAKDVVNGCLFFSIFFSLLVSASARVYRYDPQVVTLTGVLDTRVYPGAPNYESVKTGDRPNKVWLIKLPRPISMDPGPEPASFERETGIKEIHLILTDLMGEKVLKEHKGETVTFTGKIFHAHTIHHPLPVLMAVQDYKLHMPPRRN
jgi:hypothetical protein